MKLYFKNLYFYSSIWIPPTQNWETVLFFSPELYINSCSRWNGCGVHTHSHWVPWNEGVRRCWMMDGVVIAWFIAGLRRPPLPICPQHVGWYRSNIVLWWVRTGVTLNVSHKAGVSEENKKKYVVFVQFLGFKSKLGPQKVSFFCLLTWDKSFRQRFITAAIQVCFKNSQYLKKKKKSKTNCSTHPSIEPLIDDKVYRGVTVIIGSTCDVETQAMWIFFIMGPHRWTRVSSGPPQYMQNHIDRKLRPREDDESPWRRERGMMTRKDKESSRKFLNWSGGSGERG